jgi:uncharacterized protein with HEPN domain
MKGDDGVYVGHMLDAARKAHAKVAGITRAQFDADENLRLAVTHLLQISDEGRAAHPSIPWKAVVGMRHKVVHTTTSASTRTSCGTRRAASCRRSSQRSPARAEFAGA